MTDLILSTLAQGLIFSIAGLGIYISFRILDFPDLSVDSTFTTGASISAISIINGVNPFISIVLSLFGGLIAGSITGILHVKFKITNILSGIIVMIGLYSVNLRIMGKSNLHLFDTIHIFSEKNHIYKLAFLIIFTLFLKVIIDFFFKTEIGYVLKAVGQNQKFITGMGFDVDRYKILGLALANGLVALSGSLYTQYQGFSDISMGIGLIVSALASIVIGEMAFKNLKRFGVQNSSIVILGSIFYRGILSLALQIGVEPSDLKLVTALLMVLILSKGIFNSSKEKIVKRRLNSDFIKRYIQNFQ